MEVLLLGSPTAERSRLEKMLTDADCTVNACHDESWGCVGLDGTCPIDGRTVDVAVAVSEPSGRFDPQGVTCISRARIPFVVVGAEPGDPVLEYATKHLPQVDRSTVAALRSASHDASGHHRAIEASLFEHLHVGEVMHVSVRRGPDDVAVFLAGNVEATRSAVLADVARAAVRDHDPRVKVIDVSVIDQLPT